MPERSERWPNKRLPDPISHCLHCVFYFVLLADRHGDESLPLWLADCLRFLINFFSPANSPGMQLGQRTEKALSRLSHTADATLTRMSGQLEHRPEVISADMRSSKIAAIRWLAIRALPLGLSPHAEIADILCSNREAAEIKPK